MQLECPKCNQVVEYADKRPAFCSHCGQSLSALNVHEAETFAYTPPGQGAERTDFTLGTDGARVVGEYRLTRELGQGGMGVVYEAEHAESGRRVALKLLSPGSGQSPESMERFVREGRLAAALSHPRSTFVYEAGEHSGQPYITMELMPGRTLHHVCAEEGPLPVPRAVDYILDVIEGLEAAHAAGVIHRDVKPSNCFLDVDGRVKVGDFGLSKSLVADAGLTRTGAFMGTPLFAAPEQVRAGKIDARTDIYSVGATLFYLIAGRGPFVGDPAAVIAQISSDPAPSLRQLCPDVPRDVDRAVARTIEKDPDRRFSSLAELRHALLPFSSLGLSPAPLGRRFGAYFIDAILIGIVGAVLVGGSLILAAVFRGVETNLQMDSSGVSPNPSLLSTAILVSSQLGFFVTTVLYFALVEGPSGQSVGKRLLGLRVVDRNGSRPGIGHAALRSALVPGLMWISTTILLPLLFPTGQGGAPKFEPEMALAQQALQQLAFVPMLACLVTMRASNGYLGVHDKISRTRVVVLRTRADRSTVSEWPVVAAVACRDERFFGPYRITGRLGQSNGYEVLLARDDTLNRTAWIYVGTRDQCTAGTGRVSLTRATRPRWLQGGVLDGWRWDAFEAIRGSPLTELAAPGQAIPWERGRTILRELAQELVCSIEEGTLPATLSLRQVWVDREGHVKFLDRPLGIGKKPSGESGDVESSNESATALLRAATQLCTHLQSLPVHAQTYASELAVRPNTRETLDWALAQLQQFSDRTATLRWSDRLVSIGVSMGAEYPAYQVLISLVALGFMQISILSNVQHAMATLILTLTVPPLASAATYGGPVFRFLGVAVRRRNGQQAGRIRSAWRNFVAWAPLMLVFSLNAALLPLMVDQTGQLRTPDDLAPVLGFRLQHLIVFVSILTGLLMLLVSGGIIYAVARPQRGLQDLLAGTQLVPD